MLLLLLLLLLLLILLILLLYISIALFKKKRGASISYEVFQKDVGGCALRTINT